MATQLLPAPDGDLVRQGSADRLLADLPGLARARLDACGVAVPDPQAPPCTHCNAELFPSYRRGDRDQRLASFIGLAPG